MYNARLKCCYSTDQGIYLVIINGQWTTICPTSSAVALSVHTVVVMRPFCGCFSLRADCIVQSMQMCVGTQYTSVGGTVDPSD